MNILYHRYVIFLKTLIKEALFPLKPIKSLRSYQLTCINDIITEARQNTALYSSLYKNVNSPSIDQLEDIQKFPVLKKETLKTSLKERSIISKAFPFESLMPASTTGSTGEPTTIYFEKSIIKKRNTKIQSLYRSIGLFPYKRLARVWRQKKLSKIEEIFQKNTLFLPLTVGDIENPIDSALSHDTLGKNLEKLTWFDPQFIRGYVSALYTLAKYSSTASFSFPSLEGVITSAEYLPDHVWDELQQTFNCPVYNLYGGTEAPAIAISNGQDKRLYVSEDLYYVEVLDEDDQPVKPGQPGYVTITDLHSKAVPLIRYQIGDMAIVDSSFYQHEDKQRYLCSVIGRSNDIFQLADGRLIYSHFWHIFFREQDWIDKFKVIQKTPSVISIKLLPVEFNNSLFLKLKKDIETRFEGISFNWEIVSSIPLGPGEKFQAVKSCVKQEFNTINK